ncbi:hypothetical protein MA16_Dca023517 [Dendrobium catenatum]|uniref:Uncharacterized protein n=1 Tax=Dendrobium catenatum TaxID=906689 RepID=A0A2I0XHE8_9ASPA|nr:hypothetical protein MA16_Dca023517 [Dendrobium catenatum]
MASNRPSSTNHNIGRTKNNVVIREGARPSFRQEVVIEGKGKKVVIDRATGNAKENLDLNVNSCSFNPDASSFTDRIYGKGNLNGEKEKDISVVNKFNVLIDYIEEWEVVNHLKVEKPQAIVVVASIPDKKDVVDTQNNTIDGRPVEEVVQEIRDTLKKKAVKTFYPDEDDLLMEEVPVADVHMVETRSSTKDVEASKHRSDDSPVENNLELVEINQDVKKLSPPDLTPQEKNESDVLSDGDSPENNFQGSPVMIDFSDSDSHSENYNQSPEESVDLPVGFSSDEIVLVQLRDGKPPQLDGETFTTNLLFATPARQRTYLLLLPPEADREPQPKAYSLPLLTLPRTRNSRRRTSRAILEATLANPLTSSPSQDPLSLPLSVSLLKAFSGQGSSQRPIWTLAWPISTNPKRSARASPWMHSWMIENLLDHPGRSHDRPGRSVQIRGKSSRASPWIRAGRYLSS